MAAVLRFLPPGCAAVSGPYARTLPADHASIGSSGTFVSGDFHRQLGSALERQGHGPEAVGGISDIGQVVRFAIVVHHQAAEADLRRDDLHDLARERRSLAP